MQNSSLIKTNNNSKNYFEDLYQENKFIEKKELNFSHSKMKRALKNRSISNRDKEIMKKGHSL